MWIIVEDCSNFSHVILRDLSENDAKSIAADLQEGETHYKYRAERIS